MTSWKVSKDGSTDSSGVSPFLPTRVRAARSCCNTRAGDMLGNPDVCPIAPKFACPGDGGAIPDVCLPLAPKFACPGDSGELGKPDVSSSASLACPCDGGALGEPDVGLPPFFFGVIALITIRPLRKTSPGAFASCSPSCAMIPTTLMSPSIRKLPSLPC